jgi:hypothetical protein
LPGGDSPKALVAGARALDLPAVALEPLADGEYWLSLVPRLYDPSPALLANPFLAASVREPVLALTPRQCEELGLQDMDRCRVSGATDVELVVTCTKEVEPSSVGDVRVLVVNGVTPTTLGLLGEQPWIKVRVEKING